MKNEVNRTLVAKNKLFSVLAALTLSVGLWAETVSYLYPVYNDGDVIKGIKNWESTTVDAIVVDSSENTVTWGSAGATTWYVVTGEDVHLHNGAVCQGAVHLILADGAKLTSTAIDYFTPGIRVSGEGNSLTIYGQANQSGQLTVKGSVQAAGIGGGKEQDGSDITINGGTITIFGGVGAAAIGGGYRSSGSRITINGGEIDAEAGSEGAGIGGGGEGGFGSNIIINGGKVRAGGNAAGIGGGSGNSDGYNITINGGEVNASGGLSSAGIGGGNSGNGYNIAINGGTIMAFGGEFGGAGIGGGLSCVGSYITITDGVVTAIGGGKASGIGNGENAGGSSNIIVASTCVVRVGDHENSIEVIANDGTDLAKALNGKRYVTTTDELTEAYNTGYAAGKKEGLQEGDAAGYARGKAEGLEEGKSKIIADLPSDAEDATGNTVTITKGEKTLKLVNPDKVTYGKQE